MKPAFDIDCVTIYQGDCRDILAALPEQSVNCCVTSPPYWGLRDYGIAGSVWGGDAECEHVWGDELVTKAKWSNKGWDKSGLTKPVSGRPRVAEITGEMAVEKRNGQFCQSCNAWLGCYGLEPTPELYVEHTVEIFRAVRRVLRDDGTLFLNLGDSYFSGTGKERPKFLKNKASNISLSNEQSAWLAALIDGEGCIQIHQQRRNGSADSFQVDVSVGMMTDGMVKHAHEITGIGSCGLQHRDVWDWSVRGQQAGELLWQIYPWLIIKRQQAAAAIALSEDLAERKFGRGNPATQDVLDWRRRLKEAVSDLNQRNTTDFYIPEPAEYNKGGLKPKDLVGTPWLVAFALRADGWYLRSEIIWAKPNAMPESIKDRPTKSHETIFLMSKSRKYHYDWEAIAEKCKADNAEMPEKKNKRDVWMVPTAPFPKAHFATFPRKLIEPCILAGCPAGGIVLDPFTGSGTTAVVAQKNGCRFIGCEINPDYIEIAKERFQQRTLFAARAEP